MYNLSVRKKMTGREAAMFAFILLHLVTFSYGITTQPAGRVSDMHCYILFPWYKGSLFHLTYIFIYRCSLNYPVFNKNFKKLQFTK